MWSPHNVVFDLPNFEMVMARATGQNMRFDPAPENVFVEMVVMVKSTCNTLS